MNLKNLQMKNNIMTDDELYFAIHNKAYSKISFIEMELESLKKEIAAGSYTQEMIDNQIKFNERELQVWKTILHLNK